MMEEKIIFVLGYMASGKSTLGAALAKELGRPFYDLDVEIERELGTSISKYMEEKGELSFRKKEHEALLNLVERAPKDAVIALGGGTPVFYDHMTFCNEVGRTVWLDVSVGELAQRLQYDTDRPLLQNENDRVEFIAKHLFERRPYYYQAQHRIAGDNLQVSDLLKVLRD
jgi:shikimate kinase